MIRDLDEADLETARKLLSGVPEAAAWSAEDYRLALQRNLSMRVAEEEGIVRGLVVFRTMADEAEILNLAVDSTRRRRGIGSRLMKDALAACKAAGVKVMFLEVRDSNQTAQNFYLRMGFTEVGRRREYYSRPLEDALVLARTVE
jgi:[ribosomal protein S18]-alanine N-acetyltransferase